MMDILTDIEAKPLVDRIRSVETLVGRSLPAYADVRRIIEDRPARSILTITVSQDRRRVMTAALLAVLVADRASIPEKSARDAQLQPVYDLCHHFEIDVRDVIDLCHYASQFEAILMARWSPDIHA